MHKATDEQSHVRFHRQKETSAIFRAVLLAALILPLTLVSACNDAPDVAAAGPSGTSKGGVTDDYALLGLPPRWTAPAEFDCATAAPAKRSDAVGKPGGVWVGTLFECGSGHRREVLGLIAQDGQFHIFSMWEDRFDLLGGTFEMDGDTFASYGKYYFSGGPGCTDCWATSLFVTGFVSDRQHLEGRWTADWGGFGYFILDYDGIGYEDRRGGTWSTSLSGGWDGVNNGGSSLNGVDWTVDTAGRVAGSDASGCTYSGTSALADAAFNLFAVEIVVSGCAPQRNYTGFARKASGPFNDRLWVSMDDGEQRGLRLIFFSR